MKTEELKKEILRLKKELDAVIIAHIYQRDEIQEIADFTGDSLALSRKAAELKESTIIFCGVYFMAETAKILSPEKKVILPVLEAGCPMAEMIDKKLLVDFKKQHPNSVVVCYVNSTAETKAESDICCTSANAIKVVESIPKDKKILFVPDKYLGGFVKEQTNRDIVCWQGFCPTHARIDANMVKKLKIEHPKAKVLVHPECPSDVVAESDLALSTGQMIKYVSESDISEFIIGTEKGILYQLQKENPNKKFYLVNEKMLVCPNMKKITLESLYKTMKIGENNITVDPDISKKAVKAIKQMIAIG